MMVYQNWVCHNDARCLGLLLLTTLAVQWHQLEHTKRPQTQSMQIYVTIPHQY